MPGETPVILDDNVDWVEPGVQQALLRTIQDQLQQWQTDWGSLDFNRYISHYSRQFQSGGEDLPAWKKRKYAVIQQKTYIRINLQHVSVYRYPGETSLFQIDFHQLYESSNFNASADKRQYWTLEEDGYWRIIYEGLRK
jgi:murein L,D-transpeptidase YafK